jgi:hypothetical protein
MADTRFKKGQHWRPRKPYWDRGWLSAEYVGKQRSASDIAAAFGITENAILFWLAKHEIPTRSVSEVRKIKHWGSAGSANPMYGKTGSANPHWKGGYTPLRQQFYASAEWKHVCREVRRRDPECILCGGPGPYEYHHIIPFSLAPLLALYAPNVCRVCKPCHNKMKCKEMRYAKRLQNLIAGKEAKQYGVQNH